MANTCIESPGGPSAVRNTVFRQLSYFVFSNGQVDRQQFTLNKVNFTVTDFINCILCVTCFMFYFLYM